MYPLLFRRGYVHMCIDMYVYIYIHVYFYTCIYVFVYRCMNICICTHVYVSSLSAIYCSRADIGQVMVYMYESYWQYNKIVK